MYPTVVDGVPDNERMEIVGNIHDNPDLLQG
uniref:YopX protein n=1 Tax=Myoviridae sp. ctLEM34 TaxID=2825082 RepID=A0A8S5TR56_9CAUD|nr:MAG TPA: YopX protein [Myoviridae sp. ctLEM34]